MSVRTVPSILAAVFVAFGFQPANAQPKPQPPQSLRLYVLDCGIITPANVDNYGLKVNEVADTRMVTPSIEGKEWPRAGDEPPTVRSKSYGLRVMPNTDP